MRIDRESPIDAVAAEVPGAMEVFESLGLDHSCAGARSIADAARQAAIDPDAVVGRLRRLPAVQNAVSWNDRRLAEVMKHLVSEHHELVAGELRTMAVRLDDVCSSPAGVSADLHRLRSTFARLSELLLPHIREEEEDIFPVIESLERACESGRSGADARDLQQRVGRMVREHGKAEALFHAIRELRQQSRPGNELPPACQAILKGISALEGRLRQSMFLEDSVLFPRAVALTLSAPLSPAAPRAK